MLRDIETRRKRKDARRGERLCDARVIIHIPDKDFLRDYFLYNGEYGFKKLVDRLIYNPDFPLRRKRRIPDILRFIGDPKLVQYWELIDEQTLLLSCSIGFSYLDCSGYRYSGDLERFWIELLDETPEYDIIYVPVDFSVYGTYFARHIYKKKGEEGDFEHFEWDWYGLDPDEMDDMDEFERNLKALHGLNRLRHIAWNY